MSIFEADAPCAFQAVFSCAFRAYALCAFQGENLRALQADVKLVLGQNTTVARKSFVGVQTNDVQIPFAFQFF